MSFVLHHFKWANDMIEKRTIRIRLCDFVRINKPMWNSGQFSKN